MVFWLLALAGPRARTRRLAGAALALCVAVEVSQLYRAPWLAALRATPLGALALGQGFLWSDLLCYALGVAGAALVNGVLRGRGLRPGLRRGAADAGGSRRPAT